MEKDYDLHEMYGALAWGNIRAGDLDNALKYVLRIIDERQEVEDDEYVLSLGIVGGIYEGRGDIDQALYYGERCLAKALERMEKQQNDKNALIFLCSCLSISRLYQKLSRIEDALRLYQIMYSVASGYLLLFPGDTAILKLKMLACQSMADLYIRQDLPSNAYQFCKEYKECCLALIETAPNDIDVKNKLNMSNILLGDYYFRTDDINNALSHYHEAEKGAASIQSQYLSSEDLSGYADLRSTHALAYEKLSNIYEKLGDLEQAGTYSSKNEQILSDLIKNHPENFIFQYNLATYFQHTGIILHAKKNFKGALDYFDKCYQLAIKLLHQMPDITHIKRLIPIIYQYRAIIYSDMGESDLAATNYMAMCNHLRDLTKLYPDDPLMRDNLAYACLRYAFFCYEEYDNKQSAIRYLEEGYKLYKQLADDFPNIEEYQEKMEMASFGLDELKNGGSF